MAALQTPKLLLLDEHTAALDPATAAKVLEISDKIVRDGKLTALMITHNMTDAIRHGNRLIMMDQGRIVLDISGEDKQKLTKADLLARFAQTTGTQGGDGFGASVVRRNQRKRTDTTCPSFETVKNYECSPATEQRGMAQASFSCPSGNYLQSERGKTPFAFISSFLNFPSSENWTGSGAKKTFRHVERTDTTCPSFLRAYHYIGADDSVRPPNPPQRQKSKIEASF